MVVVKMGDQHVINLADPGQFSRSDDATSITTIVARPARIYKQSLPRHIPAGFRGEENDGRVQVLRLPRSFNRNSIAKIIDPFLIFVKYVVLFRAKPSRREAIHGDAVLAPIVGQAHRQLPDAAPAGPVWREACITRHTGYGADIDDASITARNHAARHGLRDEETPAEIRVKNQIPVFPGNVERRLSNIATGIVDEDVQVAKFLFGSRGHSFDAVVVADIKFQRKGAAAKPLHLLRKRQQASALTAGEHEIRPCLCERAGKILAEPTARSCNDRHPTNQIKESVA